MENRFLKLIITVVLASGIFLTKANAKALANYILSNAKLESDFGVVCDRYDIETIVGIDSKGFVKMTNSSEFFCGLKHIVSIEWESPASDIYCSCITKVGFRVNPSDNNYLKGNFLNKKFLFTTGILIWEMWNVWNNANIIYNNIRNINILPDFENIL